MADRRRFLQVLAGSVIAAGVGCTGGASSSPDGGGTRDDGGPDASGDDAARPNDAGGGSDDASATGDAATAEDASAMDAASPPDAGGDTGPPCMPRGLNAGSPSTYAANGLYSVPRTAVIIGRDAGGLYAMTSLCTHLQCDLNAFGTFGPTGVHCGCHGSEFDLVGNATHGPASSPLRHYQLRLECDGSLRVDVATVVAQDVRLAI